LWQPDNMICCKQAQQNNCRLAHTGDYDFFCNAHGYLVATRGRHPTLQTSATIFSSGNLPHNDVFFAIAHEISVATRTHVCKLSQPPKCFNNLQKHWQWSRKSSRIFGVCNQKLQTNNN
jgi:hypothetical protein